MHTQTGREGRERGKGGRGSLPGVLISRDWGTWNCIVLGGEPNGRSESSRLSSESYAALPEGLVPGVKTGWVGSGLVLAGVRTLTPGVRGLRCGDEKMSWWS